MSSDGSFLINRAVIHAFLVVFGLCFAATYFIVVRLVETQAGLPPKGPAIIRLLVVDPDERQQVHMRFAVDGLTSGGRAFAGFGGLGRIEDFFPWSAPPGPATLRATTPAGTVERVIDLAPGTCRLVAVRSGDTVLLTPCLTPVAHR